MLDGAGLGGVAELGAGPVGINVIDFLFWIFLRLGGPIPWPGWRRGPVRRAR